MLDFFELYVECIRVERYSEISQVLPYNTRVSVGSSLGEAKITP